ncbi:MAG: sulfatase-like hydrolase/transferase [Gemmatimonadaceae bacterium]
MDRVNDYIETSSAATGPGRRFADVLVTAVAVALVTGLLHAFVSWILRDVMHDLLRTYMSPDTAWMAPLGYLLLFVPLALVLAVVAATIARLNALKWSVLLFGTLGVFSFLLLFPRLHQYASLALGVGVAVRLATSAAQRADSWRRTLSRIAVTLSVAVVLLWGYQVGGRRLQERRAIAALPDAPPDAPNVLLLILDTVRASSMSLYGAERSTTPQLSEFAKSGAVFDWAFSTASWTLPSHASMFTGRYASQQTGNWNSPLDSSYPTLAEVFGRHGYATAGFTANLVATPRGFGLDRGFSRYEDHRNTIGQFALTTSLGQAQSLRNAWDAIVRQRWIGRAVRSLASFDFEPRYSYPDHDAKSASLIAGSFLRWQGGVAGRPYFAFLNFFDAHGPYESPTRYDTLFGRSDRVRDKYDRSIRYIDDELAAMFDTLRARGLLDNTIIVLASDHGEQFGEHGLAWHSNSLYEQLTHVPLFIRFPARVPAGVRVTQQVSLRDLAATLVDLAGLPAGHGFGGVTLAPTWQSPGGRGSAALSELSRGVNADVSNLNAKGDMHALADDSLHYIRNGTGTHELYAYRRDPRETQELSTGAHAALVPSFEARVKAALRESPSSPRAGQPR